MCQVHPLCLPLHPGGAVALHLGAKVDRCLGRRYCFHRSVTRTHTHLEQNHSNPNLRFPSGSGHLFASTSLSWSGRRLGLGGLSGHHHRGAGDQQEVHRQEARPGPRLESCWEHVGRSSPPWHPGSPLRPVGKGWRSGDPLCSSSEYRACRSFLLKSCCHCGGEGGGEERKNEPGKGLVQPSVLVLYLLHGLDHNRLHKLRPLSTLAPNQPPW